VASPLRLLLLLALGATVWLAPPAAAGPADVIGVSVLCEEGECVFAVRVLHEDEGFDHYADRWELLDEEGRVIATRVLAHPHVDEQPFTRRLPGVVIPPGVKQVRVRARDSRHGYGGREQVVELPPEAHAPGSGEGAP